MKKLIVIPVLLVAIGISLSNCGYRLTGFGNQVPEHIKTVVIPDFDNKTARYQLDQYITFAVKEEFIKRSDLVLADREARADAILEGTITKFDVTPISYGEDASANLYKVTIVVDVRFIDLKTNEIIFEGKGVSFNDTYEIDDDDFFSQETETLLRIAEEFAASIVTTILENF
jgi:outer membrane lipopolysaccharide assembly protein LptE/RlpB